jgi:hypothetical protein
VSGRKQRCPICLRKIEETIDLRIFGNKVVNPTLVLSQLTFNPFNAELNPIYHLLALLGAHHILHVSRIKVKSSASYI